MAKTINLIRIANAILKKGTIAGYGNHWAFNDKADGFNVVNVTVPNIPLNVKQYLEGDEDLTIYGIGTDVSKLCAYSLASFPKLEKVYLLNYTDMITLETNWDATLVYLDEIYVPESLLSRYQTEYPSETRFKILVEQATLEIPYIDTDVLTTEYVDTIIAGLLESSLPLITKVVIDDRFTQESADYIAWNYDFSMLTSLNNNIWYGTTKYDFSTLTISGSGALTSAKVEQAIEEVPSSKRSAITKVVVPVDFTSYDSGSITAIQNGGLTNLRYLETTYEGGAMTIDFQDAIWQAVISQIETLGSTLDSELVLSRSWAGNSYIKIIPPFNNPIGFDYVNACVYANNVNTNDAGSFEPFQWAENLVCVDNFTFNNSFSWTYFTFLHNGNKLKKFILTFSQGTDENKGLSTYGANKLEIIKLFGVTSDVDVSYSTLLTRNALVDLINSLGTPNTQKTLTIGATNLAKLTVDDIAIATQKGWLIQ